MSHVVEKLEKDCPRVSSYKSRTVDKVFGTGIYLEVIQGIAIEDGGGDCGGVPGHVIEVLL